MENIALHCEESEDYRRLLGLFSDCYIPAYNKRRVSNRKEIKLFMRRNFNTWYYSESPFYYVSPARFINSDIFNKFGTDAVVHPVLSPVYKKDRLMDISYAFRVFTLDDHPFVRDMFLLLDAFRGMPAQMGEECSASSLHDYIYEIFFDVGRFSEFTFFERPYAAALGDASEWLSLVSYSGADAGVVLNDEAIKAFAGLPKREQLERAISALADIFAEGFGFISDPANRPDAARVLAALERGQQITECMEDFFGDLFPSFANYLESLLGDDEDYFDDLDSLDEESSLELLGAEDFHECQLVYTTSCSRFFNVFGQYLQLIQPEYDEAFEFMRHDDMYIDAVTIDVEDDGMDLGRYKDQLAAVLYLRAPDGYGLTPLGAARAGIDISQDENQFFPFIPPDEYQETLDGMLREDYEADLEDNIIDSLFHRFDSYLVPDDDADWDEPGTAGGVAKDNLLLFSDLVSNPPNSGPSARPGLLDGPNPDSPPFDDEK